MPMKFRVHRTSNFELGEIKEFTTLEELLEFVKAEREEVIISLPTWQAEAFEDCVATLEIYDTYRE